MTAWDSDLSQQEAGNLISEKNGMASPAEYGYFFWFLKKMAWLRQPNTAIFWFRVIQCPVERTPHV